VKEFQGLKQQAHSTTHLLLRPPTISSVALIADCAAVDELHVDGESCLRPSVLQDFGRKGGLHLYNMSDVAKQAGEVDLAVPFVCVQRQLEAGRRSSLLAAIPVQLNGTIGGSESALSQLDLDPVGDAMHLVMDQGAAWNLAHLGPPWFVAVTAGCWASLTDYVAPGRGPCRGGGAWPRDSIGT